MAGLRYKTPLRYPGGKQRLTPFVAEILEANDACGWNYVEPYAGGAGVAIELLLSGLIKRAYLNDSSYPIYALWKSILREPDEFCRKILRASLTVPDWARHREVIRNPTDHSLAEVGFSAFVLNRCNRSGVLTAGVIGGTNQVGRWRIDARFPRLGLVKRVEAIAKYASKISIYNLDAEDFLLRKVNSLPKTTLVYCDPPYYAKAKRLYLDWYDRKDHEHLASVIQEQLSRPWIVSYDNHPDILKLYKHRRRFVYTLQYSAIRPYAGAEAFVFSDGLRLPKSSALPSIDTGLGRMLRRA